MELQIYNFTLLVRIETERRDLTRAGTEPGMEWGIYHTRGWSPHLCQPLLLISHIKQCKCVIWVTEDIAWLFQVNVYEWLLQSWERFRLKCGQLWGGTWAGCFHLPSLCLFSLRYNLAEKQWGQHFGTLCLCFLFFLFVVVTNTSENNIGMLSHFSFEAEILEVLAVGGFLGLYIFKYVALKSGL